MSLSFLDLTTDSSSSDELQCTERPICINLVDDDDVLDFSSTPSSSLPRQLLHQTPGQVVKKICAKKRIRVLQIKEEQRQIYNQLLAIARKDWSRHSQYGSVSNLMSTEILRPVLQALSGQDCKWNDIQTSTDLRFYDDQIAQEMKFNAPDEECSICLELFSEPMQAPCGHAFCRGCILSSIKIKAACPVCRKTCRVTDIKQCGLRDGKVTLDAKQIFLKQSLEALEGSSAHCRAIVFVPTATAQEFTQSWMYQNSISVSFCSPEELRCDFPRFLACLFHPLMDLPPSTSLPDCITHLFILEPLFGSRDLNHLGRLLTKTDLSDVIVQSIVLEDTIEEALCSSIIPVNVASICQRLFVS